VSDARPAIQDVPPGGALALLARELLADLSETAPDLTGAVVVLPNLHAASALARALCAGAGRSLLLPKMTTLAIWAAEWPVPATCVPDVVREAAVFAALRSRQWFDSSDLWQLAGELTALFDELTRFDVTLPSDVDEFERQLEMAYQARAGEAMQFEARLVIELWNALSRPRDGAIDSIAAYQLQLARIADEAACPLYAIGMPELIPAERAFFEAYARRAPVKVFRVAADLAGASASARFLATVWSPPAGDKPVLRDRAAVFSRDWPQSPIEENVDLYGAPSLEHEARAVDVQVRSWLNEGHDRIAVVALDRLVARRTRALLERARVLTHDETGWTFSTTSASTVLMRWLDALTSGFYYEELLDLVKSPFMFSGWEQRREAVFVLERAIRTHSVVAGLDACRNALAASDGADSKLANELLDRLQRGASILRRDKRRSLHEWMSLLFGSLAALNVDEGLKGDLAGLQLLERLHSLVRDLAGSEERFAFAEWRRWLDRQLELAEFRDGGVASPVIFTQLSLTRLREFDAVVLTGCDATHLPGNDRGSVFFNQSVRSQLGLPTREQQLVQVVDDLSGLISRSGRVLVTWQELRDGEPNLVSPLFERVEVFHQLAWNRNLRSRTLERLLFHGQVRPPLPAPLPLPSAPPAPSVQPHRLPVRISASGYNSLVACPYQYYGRYVLGLREPEEVREEMEKRDYGEYVHRALRRFHARFPVCGGVAREQLESALRAISDEVFRPATRISYLSHAWELRWRGLIPAYLQWQLERELQGWRFQASESEQAIDIELADATILRLEGRLDRIDARESNGRDELAVVDYKTRAAGDLRRVAKEPGEDVQLPVYAALLGEQAHEALFLALEGERAQSVSLDESAKQEIGNAIERLAAIFSRLRSGAPMPAQGVDSACQFCEMAGLCRKKYWA